VALSVHQLFFYFLALALLPWLLLGRVKTGWLVLVCSVPFLVVKLAGSSGLAAATGVSFFFFRQVSFLVDYQRGKFKRPSARDYFSYLFFPPTFLLGPLQRFASFASQRVRFSFANLSEGLWWIAQGLAYKFLVADTLRPNIERFFSAAPAPRRSRAAGRRSRPSSRSHCTIKTRREASLECIASDSAIRLVRPHPPPL
jgi:D-alanyl-lipoteichoic acid acyltransferase DltB (MBOAT superfamily)